MTLELFEAALERKVEKDSRRRVLLDQWGFDKRGIAQALAAVSQWFPHYSRHDQSHADTVLEQIAHILGQERIEQLSATDLWLMLEAAYLHDVGMVVRDDEARQWWGSESCQAFLREHEAHGELASAIEVLEGRDLDREDGAFEVRRALILVMAEYYRTQHAERAEQIVRDPTPYGLVSPRPPEIPDRLFDVLGQICAAHGKSLDRTMDLPREQNGLANDRAHPRFVACMLRLGDLLDVDSGRFCSVMLGTFGALPPTSELHRRKHASIQRLNLTPQQVEVGASCSDYGTYEVTTQWFDWLKQELAGQISRWPEIRPSEGFGELPKDHRIEVKLEGMLELGTKRPRFELERGAILELVRGANVYSQPMAFIRELVQNAVDATLIRAFRDHGSALVDLATLRQTLTAYPIVVRFSRLGPSTCGDAEEPTVRWSITVDDQGIGIRRADIDRILAVGSSARDPERVATIRQMPEWMRPSGAFGIGLQSVAMKAEQLTLRSYPWREGQGYELQVRFGKNPLGDEILAWSLDRKQGPTSDGTRAEVVIEIPKVPRYVSFSSAWGETRSLLSSYDPLVDDELPVDIYNGLTIAKDLIRSSLVPVEVWHEEQLVAKPSPTDPGWTHFDRESCVEVRTIEPVYGGKSLRSCYRGTPLWESQRFLVPAEWNEFFGASLDFMFGTARDILVLSRDRTRDDAWPELCERGTLALLSALPSWLEYLHAHDSKYLEVASVGAKLILTQQSPEGSRFWHDPRVLERVESLRAVVERHGAWRAANVLVDAGERLTVGELWSADELRLRYRLDNQFPWQIFHRDSWRRVDAWAERLFIVGWRGKACQQAERWRHDEYVFTKEERHRWCVSQDALPGLLDAIGPPYLRMVPRGVIPLVEGFEALEIGEVPQPMPWLVRGHERFLQRHPMILPFVARPIDHRIELPSLDAVVEATLQRSPHGASRAEVVDALESFIRTTHERLESTWGARIAYDLPVALEQLRRL